MGNSVGRIIIGVICFALVSGAIHSFKGDINSELKDACVDINKGCPKQEDEVTRFDGCVAGDKRITYNYTLTLPDLDAAEQTKVLGLLKTNVTNQLQTTPATKTLLSRGVTMAYHYVDTTGNKLIDFDVVSK